MARAAARTAAHCARATVALVIWASLAYATERLGTDRTRVPWYGSNGTYTLNSTTSKVAHAGYYCLQIR